jgi:hypothetical protein
MIVRRVGPVSFAKITGMLYALMGLIVGACISLFSFVGSAMAPRGVVPGGFGVLFGVGAIIALPIFYGVLGFIVSLIGAGLYNLVASWVGGVEIDVQ